MSQFLKNTAGQHVYAVTISSVDGSAKTSGVDFLITLDSGTQAAFTGTETHVGNGQWRLSPTQAETNADVIGISWAGTDVVPSGFTIYTTTKLVSSLNDITAANVRTELTTELGRIDVATSTRLATAGYTAPDNTGIADILTDTGTTLPASIAALPTDADVQTAAAAALTAYDPPTRTEATADKAEIIAALPVAPDNASITAILEDTGTTLPASIAALPTDADVQTAAGAALTAYDPPTRTEATADKDAVIAAIPTADITAILADTGTTIPASIAALPTDADVQVSAAAALTAYDPPTRAEATSDKEAVIAALPAAPDNAGIAAIQAKTDNLPASPAAVGSAMTLAADAITALTFDETTAFPLTAVDSGATQVARTGADADTLETLSDEIAAIDAGSAPSAADVADAVWDEILSGHAGVGSTGAALSAAGGSGDPWATALPGAYGAGTAGAMLSAVPDATEAQTAAAAALTAYDPPTRAELTSDKNEVIAAIPAAPDNASITAILEDTGTTIPASIAALPTDADVQVAAAAALTAYDPPTRAELTSDKAEIISSLPPAPDNASITAIKAKTDNLPASPAAVGSAMTLANDAITAAKFDESTAFPLKSSDTGATQVARTGADGDTLETLSDEIAGIGGGSAPTASQVADAVLDELIAEHVIAGSTGAALAAAGASGDPWSTILPGSYADGTAGQLIGKLDVGDPTQPVIPVPASSADPTMAVVYGYLKTPSGEIASGVRVDLTLYTGGAPSASNKIIKGRGAFGVSDEDGLVTITVERNDNITKPAKTHYKVNSDDLDFRGTELILSADTLTSGTFDLMNLIK